MDYKTIGIGVAIFIAIILWLIYKPVKKIEKEEFNNLEDIISKLERFQSQVTSKIEGKFSSTEAYSVGDKVCTPICNLIQDCHEGMSAGDIYIKYKQIERVYKKIMKLSGAKKASFVKFANQSSNVTIDETERNLNK